MLSFCPQRRVFLKNNQEIVLTESQHAELNQLRWHSSIPISPSYTTHGQVDTLSELPVIIPTSLSFRGKNVLVIGPRDGFLCFIAEALGAHRVVGVDDNREEDSFQPSLQLLKRILNSSVESFQCPLSEIRKETLGLFDIVIIADVLTHYPDPLSTLIQLGSTAKDTLLLTSHLLNEGPHFPFCASYNNFNADTQYRDVCAPNYPWFINALERAGFSPLSSSLLPSGSRLTVSAIRSSGLTPEKPQSWSEMRAHPALRNETAVVVMSCQRFEQVWDPFFKLFKKFWPECPYKVYLGTDTGSYPGVETIAVGEDRGWASNCLHILERVPASRIILFQEDFLIQGRVDSEKVEKLVTHAFEHRVGCLRMVACPGPTGVWKAAEPLGTIGPTDPYRLSMQLAIWQKDLFSSLMSEGQNPWEIEVKNQWRAAVRPEPFLCIKGSEITPVPYYITAVVKGEWQDGALDLLKQEGIPTDHIQKKIRRHALDFSSK